MQTILLKKGLDLKLKGALADPAAGPAKLVAPALVAIVPDDFPGMTPRPAVKEGDAVAAGQVVIFDKNYPELSLTAPVSGRIEAVVRGERRKLERVVIVPDGNAANAVRVDGTDKLLNADGPAVRSALMKAGLWALMRQRPYDIVCRPDAVVRDIFVTAFDSAPLAPVLLSGAIANVAALERGVAILKRLTSGRIYLGVSANSRLTALKGAEVIEFDGPHPAGNVGTQIAAVAPVNKGETILTLDVVTLWRIGKFVETGMVDFTTDVAVTGSEITSPEVVSTVMGADVRSLLSGELPEECSHHRRIISGNVLTGKRVSADGYLRYPYRQLTVIPEGDDVDEFMGWASNSLNKMSQSRSFLSHFLRGKLFAPDARINGGRRAMIMSGQYDKVIPIDIIPEFLVKAIISRDIDRMEALGIYEVAPEDFALAEYVDPSKLELQKIVREGLDYLYKELN